MSDKFKVGFNGSSLEGSYDGNADGESSVSLKIVLGEALDELSKKGESEVEVKKIRFKKEGSKIILEVDPNKDGESVVELVVDLAEAVDEAF